MTATALPISLLHLATFTVATSTAPSGPLSLVLSYTQPTSSCLQVPEPPSCFSAKTHPWLPLPVAPFARGSLCPWLPSSQALTPQLCLLCLSCSGPASLSRPLLPSQVQPCTQALLGTPASAWAILFPRKCPSLCQSCQLPVSSETWGWSLPRPGQTRAHSCV